MSEENTRVPKEEQKTSPSQAVDLVQETMNSFLATADVNRVYGEPIEQDETIIIPTAEVLVGMGFGAGMGVSSGSDEEDTPPGEGGGGGGGGRTFSRPVAVIIISPEGVRVEPVVDVTKIALAAFTAAGFMLTTLLKMLRPRADR